MDMISLQGKTNFFERRVGEYQKAGVMSSKEGKEFSITADFWKPKFLLLRMKMNIDLHNLLIFVRFNFYLIQLARI